MRDNSTFEVHQALHLLRWFGLRLRLFNQIWQSSVNRCLPFWIVVVQFDWRIEHRLVSCNVTQENVCGLVLTQARWNRGHTLCKKKQNVTEDIVRVDKKMDKLTRERTRLVAEHSELESELKKIKQ